MVIDFKQIGDAESMTQKVFNLRGPFFELGIDFKQSIFSGDFFGGTLHTKGP